MSVDVLEDGLEAASDLDPEEELGDDGVMRWRAVDEAAGEEVSAARKRVSLCYAKIKSEKPYSSRALIGRGVVTWVGWTT